MKYIFFSSIESSNPNEDESDPSGGDSNPSGGDSNPNGDDSNPNGGDSNFNEEGSSKGKGKAISYYSEPEKFNNEKGSGNITSSNYFSSSDVNKARLNSLKEKEGESSKYGVSSRQGGESSKQGGESYKKGEESSKQ